MKLLEGEFKEGDRILPGWRFPNRHPKTKKGFLNPEPNKLPYVTSVQSHTRRPYPHLVTCTIVRWLPVFVSGPYYSVVTNSLTYLRENRGLAVHAYVIMPTHVHAIVTAAHDDLSEIMRDFKKFTSRAIYELAEREGNDLLAWIFRKAAENDPRSRFKVWQDEFHPKAISSLDMFVQKADYVHSNPVRKGLVAEAEKWYYSSAESYSGGSEGPLAIDVPDW